MRDPDILATFVDEKHGVAFECVRTADDARAAFPWLPESIWGAWPVGGNKLAMATGATQGEALTRLLEKYPSLAEWKAA
jgi:hypothetical protein